MLKQLWFMETIFIIYLRSLKGKEIKFQPGLSFISKVEDCATMFFNWKKDKTDTNS
jgi:hypothetical protein